IRDFVDLLFFFQAEDGIRDFHVTGVQTCALPISSLGEAQPDNLPVNLTPISFGNFNSQANPAITSQASAPPTPIATIPKPPALGVWESVPIIIPPGNA